MNTPNYKEQPVAGRRWVRSGEVRIFNPFGGVPYLWFEEEQQFVSSDEKEQQTTKLGSLTVQFDLANPLHLQMYEVCNAIYIEEREKRDAALAG